MLLGVFLASTLLSQSLSVPATLAAKVVDAVDRNYLYADGQSWKSLRQILLLNTNATIPSLNRELASLHDGDLRIVTSAQMAAMQAETEGKEKGVGLVDFAVTIEPTTGEPKVVTPLVNSPAFRSGLRPGDVILTVNGKATRGLVHEDIMALLRADSGVLRLSVRRGGKQVLIDIPANIWEEDAVVSHHFLAGEEQLGYIGIHLFTPKSGEKTRKAVESLMALGINGCILDLRNNPGGYLDAMAIAGSAFTDQTLGWKVRRDGTKEAIHSTAKPLNAMRIVILVDEGTASAAEILAAGLHETISARLVGAKTYGRGQIQTYVALNDNAGLIIPAASVESVHGVRFNKGAGLSPDFLVPSNTDAAYQKAVELLEQR
jgi:carboxyl-terminal processing protease